MSGTNPNKHIAQPPAANQRTGSVICSTSMNFRLGEKIGEGSFAQVVRAHINNPKPGQPSVVAAKILHSKHASDQKLIEAMSKEYARMSSLSEELVVSMYVPRVYGEGKYEGRPCFLMDEVQGATLEEWLVENTKHSDSLECLVEALAVFADFARGVTALSNVAIVHGDYSPSNVLVTAGSPRVRIIDLGLAFGYDSDRRGGQVGTRKYAAAEVLSGQTPTRCSDMCSAAKIIHQALDSYWTHVRKSDLTRVGVEAVERTMQFLQRCMSDIPADRPHAQDLAKVLTDCLEIIRTSILAVELVAPMHTTPVVETTAPVVEVVTSLVVEPVEPVEPVPAAPPPRSRRPVALVGYSVLITVIAVVLGLDSEREYLTLQGAKPLSQSELSASIPPQKGNGVLRGSSKPKEDSSNATKRPAGTNESPPATSAGESAAPAPPPDGTTPPPAHVGAGSAGGQPGVPTPQTEASNATAAPKPGTVTRPCSGDKAQILRYCNEESNDDAKSTCLRRNDYKDAC